MSRPTADKPPEVSPGEIVPVVDRPEVTLAVLFGSHARGTATHGSDVDVAVAFGKQLSAQDRLELRIELTVDLIEALQTDHVDVSDLDAVRPEVGATALQTGQILIGDESIVEQYKTQFRRACEQTGTETHVDRLRQFDSILDRLENKV
jgi:predicted nucleotidyltransferase